MVSAPPKPKVRCTHPTHSPSECAFNYCTHPDHFPNACPFPRVLECLMPKCDGMAVPTRSSNYGPDYYDCTECGITQHIPNPPYVGH